MEILSSYARLSWVLRRDGLEAAVSRARAAPTMAATACDSTAARRLGAIVTRTLKPLPTDTRCLIRSLVVVRIVYRRGGDARLVLAGTAPSAAFKAHAWVEVDGVPVLPTGGSCFHRVVEL